MSYLNKLFENILEGVQIEYKKEPGISKQFTAEPALQAWTRLQLILGSWYWIHTWSRPSTLGTGDTLRGHIGHSPFPVSCWHWNDTKTRSLKEIYNVTASTKKFELHVAWYHLSCSLAFNKGIR